MKKIKISTISLKTTPLDIEGNRRNIINALQDKQVENSGIILFPELCLTGYGCEDAFYNSHLWKDAMTSLIKILPHTVGKFVVVGLPVFLSPYLYNCAAVICDGKIAGFIPKQNLANTGIHYEKRWFKEGFNEHELVSYYDMHIPFGNYLFELGDVIIGVEICEDSWVMNRTSHLHSQNGANIILSSGASHFSLGKHEIRRQIFLESSRNQNNIFVYSNLNGNEAGKVVFDAGCMVCQNGELLSEGKRYHMSDYEILNTVVDIDLNHHNRSRYFRDSYYDKTKPIRIIQLEYELEDTQEDLNRPIAVQDEDPFEAFSEVVSLGLFDYMRKTKTKGYTLSLSGGADSAACACLAYIMKHRIETELMESEKEKLKLDLSKYLCTIYQGTKNNSDTTKNAAALLAKELGAIHHDIEVDAQVELIVKMMENLLGYELNWKDHDIPLQNVQARVRSPNVWFLANVHNHLLFSTGNRSEGSTGYMTMDGDSSGSVAPLAGVSKEFVLAWLRYLHEGKYKKIGKIEALGSIINLKPSAELKPLSEAQEDEKDLMPYWLLQKIEYEFVVNGRNNREIFEALHPEIKNMSELELMKHIDRFISLFKRSQWKRERVPPSFHLDSYGLDPRYSYRFPILSV